MRPAYSLVLSHMSHLSHIKERKRLTVVLSGECEGRMDKIQKVLDLVFKRDGGTGGTGSVPKKNGRFPCLYPRGPGGSAPWVGGATAPPGCVIAGAAAPAPPRIQARKLSVVGTRGRALRSLRGPQGWIGRQGNAGPLAREVRRAFPLSARHLRLLPVAPGRRTAYMAGESPRLCRLIPRTPKLPAGLRVRRRAGPPGQ